LILGRVVYRVTLGQSLHCYNIVSTLLQRAPKRWQSERVERVAYPLPSQRKAPENLGLRGAAPFERVFSNKPSRDDTIAGTLRARMPATAIFITKLYFYSLKYLKSLNPNKTGAFR
jgi:hypothetical protein